MPELPEVETVANGVDARIRGDRIDEVWFSSKREPMKTPPAAMAKALTGRTIERVRRVGKHIVFDFAAEPKRDPIQWIVHLGMTGRLVVADPAVPRPPHTHGVLVLRSGQGARSRSSASSMRAASAAWGFIASRRRRTRPQKAPAFAAPVQNPSASRKPTSASSSTAAAPPSRRRCSTSPCCTVSATSMPTRASSAPKSVPAAWPPGLPRSELDRLHAAVQKVLREAIRLGGSSVSDYVDAAGERGFFQLRHFVYMRTGQPCLVCGTPIRRIVVAGRGTHYCPVCQR